MLVIFGAFGGLVPPFRSLGTILTPSGHRRRPREQHEAHMGIQGGILNDLGMILGPLCQSFSSTKGLKPGVVFGFVSIALSTSISKSKSGNCGFENVVFVMKVLQKTFFTEVEFWLY